MRSWKAEKELFKEYMIESFKGHRVGDQVHQIDDDTFEWFWYHLDKLKDGEPEKKLMDKLSKVEFKKFCRNKKIEELL